MNTQLVTGASGMVGLAVFKHLAARGPVLGTGHRFGGEGIRTVDLRERAVVRALLDEVKPSVVIHVAAYPDPDFCEEHPAEARRLNVDSVRWIRESLPEATPLVFISTDYVFDGRHAPYRETDPVCPINVYGQTKVEAEALLAGRPNTLILRIPLQVSLPPPGGRSGFIAQMRAQIESRVPVAVDDVLVRVPTWSADVAAAATFLLDRQASGTFHVSSPDAGTRWFWTQKLGRLLGLPVDHFTPSRAVIPRRAERPVDGKLITDKLTALGWNAYTPFDEMVRRISAPV